jgi:hypothetical protein
MTNCTKTSHLCYVIENKEVINVLKIKKLQSEAKKLALLYLVTLGQCQKIT